MQQKLYKSKYIPVIGKMYGYWKVISDKLVPHEKSGAAYFKVACTLCDNEFVREAEALTKQETKACRKCTANLLKKEKVPAKGKKFGKYTVIQERDEQVITNKQGHHMIKVQCDCGTINYVARHYLILGTVKKCRACVPKDNFKGVGNLSGDYFCSLRSGAKSRKIKFKISLEEAWNLFLKQQQRCNLTDLPLVLSPHGKKNKNYNQTASLDRIDSKKGYTIDNVQWVHKDINLMKMHLSQERFKELCSLVVKAVSCE